MRGTACAVRRCRAGKCLLWKTSWYFRALKFAQGSINVINLVEITLVVEPKGHLFSFAL